MSTLDPKSLRIGNWYYMDNPMGQGGFEKFESWNEYLDFETYGSEIILTDELLVKCGWQWNKECNAFEKYPNGDSRLFISERHMLSFKRTVFNYVLKAKICDIVYFSDLQNIYRDIIGKELEVNL